MSIERTPLEDRVPAGRGRAACLACRRAAERADHAGIELPGRTVQQRGRRGPVGGDRRAGVRPRRRHRGVGGARERRGRPRRRGGGVLLLGDGRDRCGTGAPAGRGARGGPDRLLRRPLGPARRWRRAGSLAGRARRPPRRRPWHRGRRTSGPHVAGVTEQPAAPRHGPRRAHVRGPRPWRVDSGRQHLRSAAPTASRARRSRRGAQRHQVHRRSLRPALGRRRHAGSRRRDPAAPPPEGRRCYPGGAGELPRGARRPDSRAPPRPGTAQRRGTGSDACPSTRR